MASCAHWVGFGRLGVVEAGVEDGITEEEDVVMRAPGAQLGVQTADGRSFTCGSCGSGGGREANVERRIVERAADLRHGRWNHRVGAVGSDGFDGFDNLNGAKARAVHARVRARDSTPSLRRYG